MPRTDTRDRVIRSSLELMRSRGYAGTAISDIVSESKAPRGSVTFHFPGGKEEIATEVVDLMTRDIVDQVERVAEHASTPAAVIRAQLTEIGERLESSDWVSGCPVVPIAIELADGSDLVRRACAHFFSMWQSNLARRLADCGLSDARSGQIAALTVYATEGALVVARVDRTLDALDTVANELRLLCELSNGDGDRHE